MNAPTPYLRRLLLATLLLHAPALGAQGLAVAPVLLRADAAGAPTPPAPPLALDDAADALLNQVRTLTEPGRDVSDDPVDVPCSEQGLSPELRVAGQRPETLVWRALWEYRARRTIESLNAPLPICFAANRFQPDRTFVNVIRFNSEWMSRPGRRRLEFVLSGYAAPRESASTLGQQRAGAVRQRSNANLQERLIPRDGGVSREVGKGRWVEYRLRGR